MNLKFKAEIIRRFGSQVEAANNLGIREAKLSYIIRGHALPNDRERMTLERVFGRRGIRRLLKSHD
jgi:hypothetical protein